MLKPPDWLLHRMKPPGWAVQWVARQADLHAVDFSGRDLTKANFRGANLSEAHFDSARIRHAGFASADLDGSDFTNANLSSTTSFVFGLRQVGIYRAQGVPEAPLMGSDGTGTAPYPEPGQRPSRRRKTKPEDMQMG